VLQAATRQQQQQQQWVMLVQADWRQWQCAA
jgi:hypothetical protein